MSDDAPPWPAPPVMLLSALLALISSAADRFTCSRVVLNGDVARPPAVWMPVRIASASRVNGWWKTSDRSMPKTATTLFETLPWPTYLVAALKASARPSADRRSNTSASTSGAFLAASPTGSPGAPATVVAAPGWSADRRLVDRRERAEILPDAVLEDLEVVGGQTLDGLPCLSRTTTSTTMAVTLVASPSMARWAGGCWAASVVPAARARAKRVRR